MNHQIRSREARLMPWCIFHVLFHDFLHCSAVGKCCCCRTWHNQEVCVWTARQTKEHSHILKCKCNYSQNLKDANLLPSGEKKYSILKMTKFRQLTHCELGSGVFYFEM